MSLPDRLSPGQHPVPGQVASPLANARTGAPRLTPEQAAREPRQRPTSAQWLAQIERDWGGESDLWVFGYGSLIWRPEFACTEQHLTVVHGWHRALKMWSRVNRGSPELPGLVLTLLSGGSCKGMVFRVAQANAREDLRRLWAREMPNQGVYDPKWLTCPTPNGPVKALAFTLSRQSPNFTGELTPEQYQHIFAKATGRYGTTLDYTRATWDSLRAHGIRDQHLARLLTHANAPGAPLAP